MRTCAWQKRMIRTKLSWLFLFLSWLESVFSLDTDWEFQNRNNSPHSFQWNRKFQMRTCAQRKSEPLSQWSHSGSWQSDNESLIIGGLSITVSDLLKHQKQGLVFSRHCHSSKNKKGLARHLARACNSYRERSSRSPSRQIPGKYHNITSQEQVSYRNRGKREETWEIHSGCQFTSKQQWQRGTGEMIVW